MLSTTPPLQPQTPRAPKRFPQLSWRACRLSLLLRHLCRSPRSRLRLCARMFSCCSSKLGSRASFSSACAPPAVSSLSIACAAIARVPSPQPCSKNVSRFSDACASPVRFVIANASHWKHPPSSAGSVLWFYFPSLRSAAFRKISSPRSSLTNSRTSAGSIAL